MPKIRVLIVNDYGILRAGLCMLINAQSDMEVVGQASTNYESIREAHQLNPDVIIQDLKLTDGDSIPTISQLRRECPRSHILILTMHDEVSYLRAAIAAGAAGYVAKMVADTELLTAIRAVFQGRLFVDLKSDDEGLQRILAGPAETSLTPSLSADLSAESLSPREREVLELLVRGHTNQETADRLYLSVKTVETYRARVSFKLGLRSRADFVRYGAETGLLCLASSTAFGYSREQYVRESLTKRRSMRQVPDNNDKKRRFPD